MVNQSKIGKQNRDKGQRYERKIAGILNTYFGWDLVRNLEQPRRDLHGDIVDRKTSKAPIEGMIIECKNRQFKWNDVIEFNGKGPAQWMCELTNKPGFEHYWLIFTDQNSNISYSLILTNMLMDTGALAIWSSGCLYMGKFYDVMQLVRNNLCRPKKT